MNADEAVRLYGRGDCVGMNGLVGKGRNEIVCAWPTFFASGSTFLRIDG